jgi:hypothetical protein
MRAQHLADKLRAPRAAVSFIGLLGRITLNSKTIAEKQHA